MVRYRNPGTQVFDDTEHESVNTEEITRQSGLMESQVPIGLQTPIIEDWERQSLDYWTGETSKVAIDTSSPLQGGACLRTDINVRGDIASPFDVSRGVKLRHYIRFDTHDSQDTQYVLLLLKQSASDLGKSGDGYGILVQKDAELARIERYDAGSQTNLASESGLSIPTDEYIIVETSIEFGGITMDVLTLDGGSILPSPISAADGTHKGKSNLQFRISSDEEDVGNSAFIDVIQRRPL